MPRYNHFKLLVRSLGRLRKFYRLGAPAPIIDKEKESAKREVKAVILSILLIPSSKWEVEEQVSELVARQAQAGAEAR